MRGKWLSLLILYLLLFLVSFGLGPRFLVHQPTPGEIADQVIILVNRERRDLGLEPLLVNDQLIQMARWRCEDMVEAGYYAHDAPFGHPDLYDLAARFGYDTRPREILASVGTLFGRTDDVAVLVVDSWRHSPSHWDLVISPHNVMTGVAATHDGSQIIVTQLFWNGGMFTPDEAWAHNRPSE